MAKAEGGQLEALCISRGFLRGAIWRRRKWDSVGCWGGAGEEDYSGQKNVVEKLGDTFCDPGWPRAEGGWQNQQATVGVYLL